MRHGQCAMRRNSDGQCWVERINASSDRATKAMYTPRVMSEREPSTRPYQVMAASEMEIGRLRAVLVGYVVVHPCVLVRPIRLTTLNPELPELYLPQTHGGHQFHN